MQYYSLGCTDVTYFPPFPLPSPIFQLKIKFLFNVQCASRVGLCIPSLIPKSFSLGNRLGDEDKSLYVSPSQFRGKSRK